MKAAAIVAHPDDETIWAAGTILELSQYTWTVVALCRRSDPDRAPKFARALERLGASGDLADLDDGPDQTPLRPELPERAILDLLPLRDFDLVITHGPSGEYRRHLRHEETCRAVAGLWSARLIRTAALWTFAYIYDQERGISVPDLKADIVRRLPDNIYAEKRLIMESIYGFGPDSFETRTLSPTEAFGKFDDPARLQERIKGARPL